MISTIRRSLITCAVTLTVLACGGGGDASTAPAPTTGAVYWKLDGATCSVSTPVSIQFFIDGSNVGTESLSSASAQSKGYTTSAGQHVLGARLSNTGVAWGSITATVPAGSSYTAVLPCN